MVDIIPLWEKNTIRMGKPHNKEPKLLPGPSGGRMGVMNQKDQLSQPVFFAIK
jgi:hypothetical protein